ncbi:MAG TPA: hypothetical protein VNO30_06785 [Kofleriaceae bacterium]|nr:hypothetical protein [Kofleriaceae bacterium]
MAHRKSPEAWYWSYDIKPEHLGSVLVPGVRLMRLSSYRKRGNPQLAALTHQDHGPARRHVLDLDAAAAADLVQKTGERPVSITADPGATGAPRFSLVVETGPGPVSSLHLDLDEAGARALLDDHHAIADLATYVSGGARRYAVIVEERAAHSWLFTGVTAHELDARLLEHGAALTRVRAYREGGRQLYAAVAERNEAAGWAWYGGLDPDAVARNLENNESYPVDLDATRDDEQGVRFSVVMYKTT